MRFDCQIRQSDRILTYNKGGLDYPGSDQKPPQYGSNPAPDPVYAHL